MTFEGLGKRLVFWDKETGNIISKFSADIIPQAGQIWRVPLGEHKYRAENGIKRVRVLEVEIHPLSPESHIEVEISCEPA